MWSLLEAVGGLVVSCVLYRLIQFVSAYYIPKRRLLDLGKWTVVTGATDGVGREFSLLLARRNEQHLFLIGRNEAKLLDLKKEIEDSKSFTHQVVTYTFDFTNKRADDYKELRQAFEPLDIGLLFNNVGVSQKSAMYLDALESGALEEIVSVNVNSTIHMSHAVYGGMKRRGRGGIICMGSGSAVVSEPLLSPYVGAKGAIQSFCLSLQGEARRHGILVQCQVPLFIATKMSKIRNTSLTVPSAHRYAADCLRMILGSTINGPFATPAVVSPYPIHALMLEVVSWIPQSLLERYRLGEQTKLYKRYLAKMRN